MKFVIGNNSSRNAARIFYIIISGKKDRLISWQSAKVGISCILPLPLVHPQTTVGTQEVPGGQGRGSTREGAIVRATYLGLMYTGYITVEKDVENANKYPERVVRCSKGNCYASIWTGHIGNSSFCRLVPDREVALIFLLDNLLVIWLLVAK